MIRTNMAAMRIALAVTVGVGAVAVVPQLSALGGAKKAEKCTILVTTTKPHAKPGKQVSTHSRPCPKPFCPVGGNSTPVVAQQSKPCKKVKKCKHNQVGNASKPCIARVAK